MAVTTGDSTDSLHDGKYQMMTQVWERTQACITRFEGVEYV